VLGRSGLLPAGDPIRGMLEYLRGSSGVWRKEFGDTSLGTGVWGQEFGDRSLGTEV
jgi:hypothetical protein